MALSAVLAAAAGGARAEPVRVVSLDQCADQYVLRLAPRASIVGVSHRADDPDSRLRDAALGLPRLRATYEGVLSARPTHVVRYWGGDPKLLRALEARGVRVLTVEDAADLEGVRRNVRRISEGLGAPASARAAAEVSAGMDRELAAAGGAWGGRSALYLTPGGFTAGPGTLVDAVLRAAGLRNLAGAGAFAPVPLERMILEPPSLLVLGFFDGLQRGRWSPGRLFAGRRFVRSRTAASLRGELLGCPAWFAAEAAADLAAAAPGRP